jgi:hypothetical protein
MDRALEEVLPVVEKLSAFSSAWCKEMAAVSGGGA